GAPPRSALAVVGGGEGRLDGPAALLGVQRGLELGPEGGVVGPSPERLREAIPRRLVPGQARLHPLLHRHRGGGPPARAGAVTGPAREGRGRRVVGEVVPGAIEVLAGPAHAARLFERAGGAVR